MYNDHDHELRGRAGSIGAALGVPSSSGYNGEIPLTNGAPRPMPRVPAPIASPQRTYGHGDAGNDIPMQSYGSGNGGGAFNAAGGSYEYDGSKQVKGRSRAGSFSRLPAKGSSDRRVSCLMVLVAVLTILVCGCLGLIAYLFQSSSMMMPAGASRNADGQLVFDCSQCTAEQLAAANTGRARVSVGETPFDVDASAVTMSPEAQAIVSDVRGGQQVDSARVLALPAQEQFPVLLEVALNSALEAGDHSKLVEEALSYPGKDVLVNWGSGSTAPDSLPTEPIFAGDRLAFYYEELYDVYQFHTQEAFDSCDFSEAASLLGDRYAGTAREGVVVSLSDTGEYYFSTSLGLPGTSDEMGARCRAGFKWTVTAAVPGPDDLVLVPPNLSGGGGGGSGLADVELGEIKGVLQALTQHLVVESTAREQRVRGEGQSGLSRVRGYTGGRSSYNEGSFANSAIANIHDHANHYYTVGMGELHAVLNGVEFWTRHNDYLMREADPVSTTYHATQPIAYPDVPASVLNAGDVNAQAEEMRQYFRAWAEQDESVRDYKPYFKANLCVLEGTWIAAQNDIEEPFASDRHEINAKTFRQLHSRVRYYLNSGLKDNLENLPFLPSSVRDIDDNNLPVFANWEYRIVCKPLKDDVPLGRFRVADDLHVQLRKGVPLTKTDLAKTRRARFELHPRLTTQNPPWNKDMSWPSTYGREFLDELMEQVPGKSPYANLTDDSFNMLSTKWSDGSELNTAFYSRYYQLNERDAMGRNQRRRSFSDPTFWAAMTDHERVVPLTVFDDEGVKYTQRWSYAVPLEIVYTTPLSSWNPWNVESNLDPTAMEFRNRCDDSERITGTADDPYQCAAYSRTFFRTPKEFFAGSQASSDAADTSSKAVHMVTPSGVKEVFGSGVWIHLPGIAGVNNGEPLRTRFPIVPIHEMDNTAYKEIKAVNDVAFADPSSSLAEVRDDVFGVSLLLSGGSHSHTLYLDPEMVGMLNNMQSVTAQASTANGHQHTVALTSTADSFSILTCDDIATSCADGHSSLTRVIL